MEVPGFEIDRELGAGASGRVYLAREKTGLLRTVALKVFDAEHAPDFDRELAVTRSIEEVRRREHAIELVQALGSGQEGGLSWIVLEYLEPGSLADIVSKDGPLSGERVLGCGKDAARALALLHGAGLFHRDVKPANLLEGPDGRIRLGDFGLSRALDGTLTAAGSPAFAAPEMIAGRPTEGRLVDVYSLGATLSFLLTGEAILPGRPDVFSLEKQKVPRPLQQVIARACALDPSERFATMEAFAEALVMEGEGKSRKKSRTKSATHDVPAKKGVARMETKLSKEIVAAAIVALVCSFLPWGRHVFFVSPVGEASTYVWPWSVTLSLGPVDIPGLATAVFALGILAIEILRYRDVLASGSRRIVGILGLAGTALVIFVLHDLSVRDARFGIALLAVASAFVCVLSVLVKEWLVTRRRRIWIEKKKPDSPLEVQLWKSKRRRELRARESSEQPAETSDATEAAPEAPSSTST